MVNVNFNKIYIFLLFHQDFMHRHCVSVIFYMQMPNLLGNASFVIALVGLFSFFFSLPHLSLGIIYYDTEYSVVPGSVIVQQPSDQTVEQP